MNKDEEATMDEFLDKFRRKPGEARPDWALKPDASGRLDAALDSVPLFMSAAPTSGDVADSPALQALQSLLYDYEGESPDEIAHNFRRQGNEAFAEKRWKDAAGFYGQGIGVAGVGTELKSVLYGNRAAASMQAGQWTAALSDCKLALKLPGSNRQKIVERGLRCAVKLKDLGFIRCHADGCADTNIKAELSVLLSSTDEPDPKIILAEHLSSRHHLEHEEHCEADLLGLLPSLDRSALPTVRLEGGVSVWPVLVFYPEHAQCDFIERFAEDDTFADHLRWLFTEQPEWDATGSYFPSNLCVYIIRPRDRALIMIDHGMRLADLFPKIIDKYDQGIIGLHVIPRSSDQALAEFSSRFAIQSLASPN